MATAAFFDRPKLFTFVFVSICSVNNRNGYENFNNPQTPGDMQQNESSHQNNSMTHLNEPLDQLNAMEKSLSDQVILISQI